MIKIKFNLNMYVQFCTLYLKVYMWGLRCFLVAACLRTKQNNNNETKTLVFQLIRMLAWEENGTEIIWEPTIRQTEIIGALHESYCHIAIKCRAKPKWIDLALH